MELTTRVTPEIVTKELKHSSSITAGQQLKFEVGENELATTVPPGKKWFVRTEIHVTETDA